MYRSLIKLGLLLLIPFGSLYAQKELNVFQFDREQRWINRSIEGNLGLGYQSNFLDISSTIDLYTNPVVNNALLNDFAAKSQETNQTYFQSPFRISFVSPINDHMSWSAGLVQETRLFLSTTHQAFQLLAKGNTPYKGQLIDIGENQLDFYNANGVSLGWNQRIRRQRVQWVFQLNVDLLQSNNLLQFETEGTELFTEENAEYLELDFDYNYLYQSSPAAFSGLGFQTFAKVEVIFNDKLGFNISLANLGKTWWNNPDFKSATATGSLKYEGLFFEFNELETFGDTQQIQQTVDSIVDILRPEVKTDGSYALPYLLATSMFAQVGQNGLLKVQVSAIPSWVRTFSLKADYDFLLKERLLVNINYLNGLFNSNGLGMGLGYRTEKLNVMLKTTGLLNFQRRTNPGVIGELSFAYQFLSSDT